MGSSIAQAFARSVVEAVQGLVDLDIADAKQAHLFGEELAQQAVGVLVGATLPGVIGTGEIDAGVQALADELVLGKLLATSQR